MLFSQESPRPFFAASCRDMSIDALQLLTKQIIAQVQTLLSASAPPPEGKHADLLEPLYTAFGQGLAIVGGLMNATAPINRIPPELLASIFALSPRTHSHGLQLPYWPFEEPHVEDLHELPKVCRYWRELALTTPTLWNSVVTVAHSQDSDYCFRRSIYLPADLTVDLVVHFNPRSPSKHSIQKMTEFMQTNAPKIRELHAWDTSSIEDLPLFLRSFDAIALEHCTIWQKRGFELEVPRGTSPEPGHLYFFSNGAPRLRSLCLTDIRVLPENDFPALTLLKISFLKRRDTNLCWNVEDLVEFLAGSPKLEEVYVHDMPYSGHNSSRKYPVSSTTVSLPRLQYLAFTYYLDTGSDDDDATNPFDFLLSRISIPPTCHMYLAAPTVSMKRDFTTAAVDILGSVCRRVPGKDAVSHISLRLSDISSPMQLVFRQGSLRLQIPPPDASGTFIVNPHQDLFRAFPHLFATAEEVRIHYTNDRLMTALASLFSASTAFPSLTAISIIRDGDVWWPTESKPTLRAGLTHLIQPSASSTAGGVESAGREHCPYPALDTLWTSLKASDEIDELETTLAARVSLGLPIRRLIVMVHYSLSADSTDVARLRALDVEEVIVMELDPATSGVIREVDWMGGLPEKYSLPSSVHRDWPTVWGSQK